METFSSDNKKQQQHSVNDKEAQTCIVSYDCNDLLVVVFTIFRGRH